MEFSYSQTENFEMEKLSSDTGYFKKPVEINRGIRSLYSYALSFYRSQNFLCPSKIFCANENLIALNAPSKTKFTEWKLSFGVAQNVWDLHNMYVHQFSVWYKKFGPAQNILGPVEGRRIRLRTQILRGS
jgi:hypothetical protein